jgi:hypothetical protein
MIAALFARVVSPIVYIPLILTALSGLYGYGWLKGFSTAKERSALVWQRTLEKAQQEADHRVQEALDAAEEVAPTPTTDADLAGLCKSDPACRDRKG